MRILTLLALVSMPLSAQSRIVGTWVVRYTRQIPATHMREGAVEPARARMTLRVRGDSIVGEWQPVTTAPATSLPAREVHGTFVRDTLVAELSPSPTEDEGIIATISAIGRTVADSLRSWIHRVPVTRTVLELVPRGDSLIGSLRAQSADGRVTGGRTAATATRN